MTAGPVIDLQTEPEQVKDSRLTLELIIKPHMLERAGIFTLCVVFNENWRPLASHVLIRLELSYAETDTVNT